MFKRLFTMFVLIAFCSMQPAFAIDMHAIDLSESNVFEDNDQELDIRHSVQDKLSPIEKIYNGKENAMTGNILYQAGYEQFGNNAGNKATTGKYDNSYKLSIGEKVEILSFGDSVDVISLSGSNLIKPKEISEVGSNGSLFVQGIGMVKAEGKTLGEVESEINKMAKSKYTNMKIKLQIPASNEFSVFVYGEVNKPGKVYVSNNSSVMDALIAAGGVKKSGTLRNIKYNNRYVDLYNFLFLGNDNNIIVKANDKIFVDKIKNTMSFKNGVKAPGIYEFKSGETIGDLMKYAGDLMVTTQRNEVVVESFDKNLNQKKARNVEYMTAKNTKVVDGDAIQFQEMYNDVENIVTLQGNIKHPATFAYKEGMRLSDILLDEDELMEESFAYQAVIRRVVGENHEVHTIPIYLKEFFAGMSDPILLPRDTVTVYKNTNRAFIDVYGCINTPKHVPFVAGMKLSDIISDIQFIKSSTASVDEENTENVSTGPNEQFEKDGGLVKIKTTTENLNKLIPTEDIAVEITNKDGKRVRMFYLYDIMLNSDAIKTISLAAEEKIFFRTLRHDEIIKRVRITGFVQRPGTYSFIKGQKLTELIEQAGGLREEADMRGIVFKRANLKTKQVNLARYNTERDIKLIEGRLAAGYKQQEVDNNRKMTLIEQMEKDQLEFGKQYTGQIALNIKSNDLSQISDTDNLEMQDGDDVYIPRLSTYISVLGEVYNEQSFIFREKSHVKDYIKEVGGYTPNANKFRIYKIGVNGKAERVSMRTKVEMGDTIVVPRRIAGNDWVTPIVQALQGVAYVAITALAIARWK